MIRLWKIFFLKKIWTVKGNVEATYTSVEVYSDFKEVGLRLITIRATNFNGRVINAR